MALQTSKRNKALLTPDFCSAKPILDADLQNCKTIDLCCFAEVDALIPAFGDAAYQASGTGEGKVKGTYIS